MGLFGLQYGISSIRTQLNNKQSLIDSARSEADALQAQIFKGMASQRKVNDIKTKSLPTNTQYMIASYGDWLTSLAQDAGLTEIKSPRPTQHSKKSAALTTYKFSLEGNCRTDQLLDLLTRYYQKDVLHSISLLKLTMTKQANVLKVNLESQVAALRIADQKQPLSETPSTRLAQPAETIKQSIINNNPFAPPNKPPRLTTKGSHEVKRGEDWVLKLEGQDPELEPIRYELVSTEVPNGLKLSSRGEVSWKPTENGSHEIVVRAIDGGLPAKSSEHKLAIKVVDPPAPEVKPVEKKFDPATQSRISGMVGGREGPQAWVRSLSDGKRLELTVGQQFEIGTIKAKVLSINLKESFVELETDGLRWTVGMDQPLTEAFEKSKAD